MSHNSFGNLLKFTTWGESHGEAIGCVVDGSQQEYLSIQNMFKQD